jgi:hypothetical protein
MSGDVFVSFGADTSRLEVAFATARTETRALAGEMSRLARAQIEASGAARTQIGEQMLTVARQMGVAKREMSEAAAGIREFGHAGHESVDVFERMSQGLSSMMAPVTAVRSHFAELLEVAAAAFAVERVVEWASETTEAMENVERESHKLGVSMEEIQRLQGISKLTGTDYQELSTQLARMQLQLGRVAEKSSPAAAALRALGIDVAQFRALGVDQQFDRIAQAMSRFADGGAKTAAAEALLGRAGADLIPILDRGKEGMEELRQTVERSGYVMSGEMVGAMAQTHERMSELSLSWRGLSEEILSAFNPAIQGATTLLADLVESFRASAAEGGVLRTVLDLIDGAFLMVESAVSLAIQGLGDFIAVAEGALRAVGQAFVNLGVVMKDVLTLHFAAAKEDFAAGMSQIANIVATTTATISKNAENAKRELTAMWSTLLNPPKAAEGGGEHAAKPAVPLMDLGGGGKGGNDASQSVTEAYHKSVEVAKEAADDTQTTLDSLLRRHKIGMDQWAADSIAALHKEADAVKAAAQTALASSALTSQQKIALAEEERQKLHDIAHKIAEDQNTAAEASLKSWQKISDNITSLLDSQVGALLRGTESMAQAFKNMAASVIEELIKLGIKLATDAALAEALTFLTGGATGGIGALFGGFHLPGFDIGAWSVPSDQIAMVHRNELVMPAGPAQAFRQMLTHASQGGVAAGGVAAGGVAAGGVSRGGDIHNWHITSNARDPRDVAREVADLWSRNPTMRPAY